MHSATTWLLAALCIILSAFHLQAEKIAIISDTHVTPGNDNDKQLRVAVDEINAGDADLVIVSGDITNEGSDSELKNAKSILDMISKPMCVIPGNHENNWSQSAGKTFVDLWGADRFVTETDNLIIAGVNCGPYMKMGDGHIKQEDLIWLDETLASRTAATGKQVLSVCHYPINPDLDNCTDYVRLLQRYPVVTHICGHYHTFKHYTTGGIDGLICRSLFMNGTFGYSILDIRNDSVFLYDKQLGKQPALMFCYPINTSFKPYEPTDTMRYNLPENVKIDLVFRDNASIFTRVGIDDENIYTGNSLGYVKAVNKASGNIAWEYHTAASLFSRPAITGDAVAIPTADRRLLWLDKHTGKLMHEYIADGPYVADGTIAGNMLLQGGYKKFQAWDTHSRKLLWENDSLTNYCQAAPTVCGDKVVFGAWDTYLRCLDTNTGTTLWKWNNGSTNRLFSPGNCVPVIANGKVIIVAPDRYMTALDLETGRVLWRNNDYKYRESLGASENGDRVYAKTMDGEVVAVSTTSDDFDLLWRVDTGLGYEHAPCIVLESDGTIYVGSRRGIMVAIDAATHEILYTYRLGSSEFNGWERDTNGDIYTSLIEGTVWRISRR